jgi:hypothetical protein
MSILTYVKYDIIPPCGFGRRSETHLPRSLYAVLRADVAVGPHGQCVVPSFF